MGDVRKCYTCQHWQGDRGKVRKAVKFEKAMGHDPERMIDPRNGWSPNGVCLELHKELGLVSNDADMYVSASSPETPAGFGCDFWEKVDDDA